MLVLRAFESRFFYSHFFALSVRFDKNCGRPNEAPASSGFCARGHFIFARARARDNCVDFVHFDDLGALARRMSRQRSDSDNRLIFLHHQTFESRLSHKAAAAAAATVCLAVRTQ